MGHFVKKENTRYGKHSTLWGQSPKCTNGGNYTEFLNMIDAYAPGKSLHEKVKQFLYACGVTTECIKKIVNIIKK